MEQELEMFSVAGKNLVGMTLMNWYCPDTVTVTMSPGTRLVTVAELPA
jgi:hypothetical protein